MRSRLPKDVVEQPADVGVLVGFLYITELNVPLDADLHKVWDLVVESIVDEQRASRWADNGLRVGMVGADHLEAFASVMPGVLGSRSSRVSVSDELKPIFEGPWHRSSVRIELRESSDATEQRVQLPAGLFGLLGAADVRPNGEITVRLVPYHRRRRGLSFTVGKPHDLHEDRLFESLMLDGLRLEGNRLVIGYFPRESTILEQPADEYSEGDGEGGDNQPEIAVETPTTQPAVTSPPPEELEIDGPDEPRQMSYVSDLGRRTLTASFLGRPVQRLLIIALMTGERAGTE